MAARRRLGFSLQPGPLEEHLTHFSLLAGLTLLAHASRWPIRTSTLVGLLALYAVVTETLQGLNPDRTVELKDYVENLLGVVVGTLLWRWYVARRAGRGEAENG